MFVNKITQDPSAHCFACGRWYYHVRLDRCPRCASDAIEHYTASELQLLSRTYGDGQSGAAIDRRLYEGKRAA